jgi:phosphoribosylformylglycinamidine synthase
VVRIRGTRLAVAATTDCNGRFVYLDPGVGARAAMAEAARNLVCVGALPTAITNNLNFGNPLKKHIYHQFREAVLGMAEACKIFETPVTGGNVSFYNETDGQAIYPTPVIGMVGVVDDVDHITPQAFRDAGDSVILLGRNTDELGGSEYLYVTADLVAGAPPAVDLLAERSLQQAVLAMIQAGSVRSAHDCAEGGLACALAESALGSGEVPRGLDVELDDDLPPVAVLFGEAQGRVVVSCTPENAENVLRIAERHGVPARRIGTVGEPGGRIRISVKNASVDAEVDRVASAYYGAIPSIMDAPATSGV